MIWRLVLNLKLAAWQEHHIVGTMSSLHAEVPGNNLNASGLGQPRVSSSIRELGGQLLLPGEDIDIDYDQEAEQDMELNPVGEGQTA